MLYDEEEDEENINFNYSFLSIFLVRSVFNQILITSHDFICYFIRLKTQPERILFKFKKYEKKYTLFYY
jgi:hypothetical protein